MAAQLISRIREEFKVELPLKHVFTSPTVAALATVIDEAVTNCSNEEPAMTIPRANRRTIPAQTSLRQS